MPEPYVGLTIPAREFTVTKEMTDWYRSGLAVDHKEPPPQMLANAVDTANGVMFSQQRGHLWLRQEWDFHAPLEAGRTYSVEGRVTDIYPRRDRKILLTETELRDSQGALVSVQRHHQSFLVDAPVGEVTFRDPRAKEGSRTFERPTGELLGSLERTVTLEMCGEFFHGSRSYHTDEKQSQALGFRDVVVGGRMTMGYIGELLESTLGERWARSGRLLVKFTNVLWPNERIVARVLDCGATTDGRRSVFGWVEKSDGVTVLVAEGTVER